MGHYLDPLLDEIKAKYSADTQDAHASGWDEGVEYVERIILNHARNTGTDLSDLLEFIHSRPNL